MERRNGQPESWVWETEDGPVWLQRACRCDALIPSVSKRGVGMDTISEYFLRVFVLRRRWAVRPLPRLSRVMAALVVTIEATARGWEQDGVAQGEVREIIGAVDETFLEQMILVFQDVPTGYIVQEEVADDRTYATWRCREMSG